MTNFEDVHEIISILQRINCEKTVQKCEEDKINKIYFELCKSCIPKGLTEGEDVPYSEKDFEFAAQDTLPYLKCICRIIEELESLSEACAYLQISTLERVLLNAFIVASQFQDSNFHWSNQECSSIAVTILDILTRISGTSFVSELLVKKEKSNDSYFVKIFPSGILHPYFREFANIVTKNTWKRYPAYIESFTWILFLVKSPDLAEYIPYFLPPALFILDDWEQRHKVMGVKALNHILQNTPHSEIRWFGRGDVIYDVLKHQIYSRESALLQHAYPALILAATVLENNPKHSTSMKKPYFDFILDHLLREMVHEERLSHRTVYARALKYLVDVCGIFALRWSEKILNICSNYLATYEGREGQDRLIILQTLQSYIKNCWPRIHTRVELILKMLLKLVYEIALEEPVILNKEILICESKSVVALLSAASPVTVQNQLATLDALDIPHKGLLNDVITYEASPQPRFS